jgi:hypothetical protein
MVLLKTPSAEAPEHARADEPARKEKEMKKFLMITAAVAALATPALAYNDAKDEVMFMHNGSLMRMVNLSYGRGIEIRYVEPRPGLQDVGVHEGTILFNGRWQGNNLVGQARTFSSGCNPMTYEVKGWVGRYGEIVLEAPRAPVVKPYACYVVEWSKNPNAYLRFDRVND